MSVIKVNNITSRDGATGPVIAGITTVSSTSHLVVPTGSTGQRVALAPDPYINNLVLALPFNSESVFSDLSPKNNSPMPTGIGTTTASLPFGQSGVTTTSSGIVTFSKYYGTSARFDGSGDYLTVTSTSDLTFGTGDFTLEYWINTTDTDFNFMHPDSEAKTTGYWGHLIQSSTFKWNDAYNSTNLWIVSATPILDGGWHHCAICRASGVTKVFFDGVSQSATSGTFTDGTNYSGTTAWEIGGNGNLSDLIGYLQDLRIYRGIAKYTSNFTPPNQIAL